MDPSYDNFGDVNTLLNLRNN